MHKFVEPTQIALRCQSVLRTLQSVALDFNRGRRLGTMLLIL
jgi:hypothetical protein